MSPRREVSKQTNPEASKSQPCPCCQSPLPGTAKGWHQKKGPLPLLKKRHGTASGLRVAPWLDHTYRLSLEDHRWAYVAEPYEIDTEAIADLIHLMSHGFDINIRASAARHNPGFTIAIEIIQTP